MKISIIIVTYNQPEALKVILQSIALQTKKPFEVIIADDGSSEETRQVISIIQTNFPVPIIHVWHEDKGFRAAAIRNLAVKSSSGDYLIFSDGDLVLHPKFVEDFQKNIKPGEALIGSRVFLSREATEKQKHAKNQDFYISFFSSQIENNRVNAIRIPLLTKCFKTIRFSTKLRGGLLGTWRNDLIAVNGWNETFEGWGLEDTELVARLFNSGIVFRKIKHCAITYHLWHKIQEREQLGANSEILKHTIEQKLAICKKGINDLE